MLLELLNNNETVDNDICKMKVREAYGKALIIGLISTGIITFLCIHWCKRR